MVFKFPCYLIPIPFSNPDVPLWVLLYPSESISGGERAFSGLK
jgi:hypothetical protein